MLVSKLFANQAIRFATVGVSNTVIDFVVFMLLQSFTGVVAAQFIGYGAGTLNSYLWNRRWTFARGKGFDFSEILRFLLVNITVAIITAIAISLVPASIPVWIAKIAVTILGLGINYTVSKLWVFR
ncbi:putative flippase GtrA [Paenibacillus sp. SORGH_AS306]|uniref:GtrA family protein n=1 Tax=unclassified Paenibacillus TaxID=185978 RepID=UPI002784E1D6|nr:MULTISPECIES: GtrA family protein [unclassified Paenibacillus]MDQ1235667.1 putative flippase GtrA [Paenibacillus sp. SORGH_AS_0306]MDR6112716.1 putative flippase GtrA [Paenibacillus sp. SORGH_AS_0338]